MPPFDPEAEDITEIGYTGMDKIARALRDLGNGDAATLMGALEALGVCIKEGLEAVATAISELAEAVREHGE
jgi:hypothetical protein